MNEVAQSSFDPRMIAIHQIVITQGHIKTEESFLSNPVQPVKTRVNVDTKFHFNSPTNRARVIIRTFFQSLDEKDREVGISGFYEIHFDMGLPNMGQFVQKNEQGLEAISQGVAAAFVSVAYSTARGIVYERTMGTIARGVMLPVVNASTLIQDQVDAQAAEAQTPPQKRVSKAAKRSKMRGFASE